MSGFGRCHQFYETFKHEGLGSVILSFAAARRAARIPLRISADIEIFPSEENGIRLARGLEDSFGDPGAELSFALSGRDLETLENIRSLIRRIFVDLAARDVRQLKGPHGQVSWLYHHMGTCRMGDDPQHSVTDRHLRVHESPNLYVAGSAVFVTAGASNPTLTIAALSHRLSDHLHARLAANGLPKDHAGSLAAGGQHA